HHRASAERVLRDYARLAASRFALRTGANLYYMAAWPPMEALLHTQAGARAPLPRPKRLAPGLKPYAAAVLEQARYTFRLDLATGRLETSGGAPSAAERAWLRDTLPVHARTVYQPEEHLAVIVAQVAGEPHAVMYTGMEKAGVQLRREYELARLRTDFVSGVSHELRTPLAQIRMFSETLLLGRVRSEEEGRRSLEIIDQEARRLTHLVENLLHFSRSERQVTRL